MALQATTTTIASCFFKKRIYGPMTPLKGRGNPCFATTNSSSKPSSPNPIITTDNHQQDHIIVRPVENFSPHIWGDRFTTLSFTSSELESCSRKVEELKKIVKDMLLSCADHDPIENMILINSLCRLGVSYHFETEIEEQLSHLFITLPQLMEHNDYDLHIVAVIFQVFRSHGYKMPCDVFNKFKNDDGMFKEELASDIKGIISLYEASHWGTHGEQILDEALIFTELHLESMVISQSCPDHLKVYIENALNLPYHKCTPRLEARQYISYYERDESRDEIQLKFAKYDFNRVMMLHQLELSLLSSWWKESNVASRFPHGRQRIVESFFVAVETIFEPRFAVARSVMCKWYIGLTLLDDTYDAYGLYQEIQSMTKAMQRWDRSAIDELPGDYLRNIYETILNISDEVEETMCKEERSFTVFYAKREVMRMVETYHVQARWTHEHIHPTFDEYLENGMLSVGAIMTMSMLMMGMKEADDDAYQWLMNCNDKILKASCALCRLYNDIQSNEDEENRGGQLSGITCYMKEYGVSKEEAIKCFKERIRVAWKDLNDAFMVRPTPVPRKIFMQAFNLARVSQVSYKDDDGFTKPEISLKNYITKILIDLIPLEE